jgi:cytochrome c oxidase assembly protein subunit 11
VTTNSKTVNGKLVKRLVFICLGMFAFGYALVPLYDVFCDITGLNGKTSNEVATASKHIDEGRKIKVELLANRDPGIPWEFAPEVESVSLNPGEVKILNFYVKNLSDQAMIGRSVPSVSPGEAAKYFKKIECFCFVEQPLNAGEEKNLPVQFYVDPELPEKFTTITLSYRLYKSESS